MEGKQAIPGQGKDSTSHTCLFLRQVFVVKLKRKKKVSGIASPLQYIQWTSSYILLMEGLDWNSCCKSGRGVIWGPLYSLDMGHRRSQKKVHTERLMQLACCADAGQPLGQGESLWVWCLCPKITSECSLHSLQAEEKGTGLLWTPNSHRSHSCKLHFLLASLVYNLPCKLISINPFLDNFSGALSMVSSLKILNFCKWEDFQESGTAILSFITHML